MSERRVIHMTLLIFASAENDDLRFMENELLARRKDDEDAARSLDIDPPEPGSPLARAFAANARLRAERDAAYAKGVADAKAQFVKDVWALQEKLSDAVRCQCGALRAAHFGTFQLGYCERTGCPGFRPVPVPRLYAKVLIRKNAALDGEAMVHFGNLSLDRADGVRGTLVQCYAPCAARPVAWWVVQHETTHGEDVRAVYAVTEIGPAS